MVNKKRKKIICFGIILIFSLLLVSQANAAEIRYFLQERLEHGHVLYISNVMTEPSCITI
jgi:hypothetical protein